MPEWSPEIVVDEPLARRAKGLDHVERESLDGLERTLADPKAGSPRRSRRVQVEP